MRDPSTLVVGETLVDFIPDRPGTLADVESFSPRPGGAPANVAVAMTRLDRPPFFLTRIGTDEFGDQLVSELANVGVPGRFVQRDDRTTTLAFVTHDESADRSFSFYRENAADGHLTTATVPDGTLDQIERVALGGVLLTTEPARTAMFDLVDRARDHDCTVVFDPNSRPELWDDDCDPVAVTESMLERVDVVKTASDDFATFDYPSTPERLAARILDHGPHSVLLTRGRAGAILHAASDAPWGGGVWSHAGFDADAVDTTGAGDAFLGGALTFLADASAGDVVDPDELLAFANAVAALTTTGVGAWSTLPDRETVAEFRSEYE